MTEQEHIQDWLREHFPGIEAAANVPRLQPSDEMMEAGIVELMSVVFHVSCDPELTYRAAVRRIWRAMEATSIAEGAET